MIVNQQKSRQEDVCTPTSKLTIKRSGQQDHFFLGDNDTIEDSNNSFYAKHMKPKIGFPFPAICAEMMTVQHWKEIYYYEKLYSSFDWCFVSRQRVLDNKHHMAREHRYMIVSWMSEACSLFKWCVQTFFVSVHAWDCYLLLTANEICSQDLAKLSAACLYFGAQLTESAADENVKTLEEFISICPEIGTTEELKEIEAHLVDTLQGISLIRRTPLDFMLLYLAELQIAPRRYSVILMTLQKKNWLYILSDLVLYVASTIYLNGLVLDGIPASYWVISTMLEVFELVHRPLRENPYFREDFCLTVFHVSYRAIAPYKENIFDPVVKTTWNLLELSHEKLKNRYVLDGNKIEQKKNSFTFYKHSNFFSKWPLNLPSFQLIQTLSSTLQHHLFYSHPQLSVYVAHSLMLEELFSKDTKLKNNDTTTNKILSKNEYGVF